MKQMSLLQGEGIHRHDCPLCIFLVTTRCPDTGAWNDLYFCSPEEGRFYLINRYGSSKANYGSARFDKNVRRPTLTYLLSLAFDLAIGENLMPDWI